MPVRNLVLIGLGAVAVLAIVVTAIVFSLGGKPNQSPTQVAAAPTGTITATTASTIPTSQVATTVAGTVTARPTTTNPKTTAASSGIPTPAPTNGKATPTPGGGSNGSGGIIETLKMDNSGKKGGSLNYAFAGTGPSVINPYLSADAIDQKLATQAYASLAGQSADAKYYPYLLTSIPTLDNGLLKVATDNKTMTMTLHLKPDARWSDGSPMTGADLKYTWQWVTDKANTDYQGDTGGWGLIADITTPDASTAVLKFRQVYGPYLQFLANFYPLPQAVWSKIDFKEDGPAKSPEATKPSVTSGPFTVGEFVTKDHVTFARNNNFSWVWGFNAYLDKLTFRWTDGNTAAMRAFQNGNLDLVDNLNDSVVVTATKAAGNSGKFEMTQGPTWEFLQFNLGNPLLQDKAVRQALLMAIDRDALIKQFYTPQGQPLATTCNPVSAFCPPGLKVYSYNLGTAKKLLTDAGWKEGSDGVRTKNGTRLTINLNTTTSAGPSAVADAIVAYWKDLGVDSKVVTAPPGQFYGSWNNNGVLKRGNFDVALYAYGTDLDPHSGFYSYVSDYIPSDATRGSGSNYGRINDPRIDEDFKTERTTVDLDKRLEAFHDFYQVLYDNIYEAALFSRTDNHLVSNKLHNFKANPTGIGNLWNSVEIWLG
ncbi:MAG: peptide ABC transporter substrate-binding protein [Chloroflexi bacterium]|nr:peptide ABC transporter substrate-binding protein [Chloroflexota bacterium]OJW04409.1 MAG: hypothetical protein BGO39_11715 [Chloroflexi bacterium 54-19]